MSVSQGTEDAPMSTEMAEGALLSSDPHADGGRKEDFQAGELHPQRHRAVEMVLNP